MIEHCLTKAEALRVLTEAPARSVLINPDIIMAPQVASMMALRQTGNVIQLKLETAYEARAFCCRLVFTDTKRGRSVMTNGNLN